jgi:hypothetical protein
MDEIELLRQKIDHLKQELEVLEECQCKTPAEESYNTKYGHYPPAEYKYSTNNSWSFFKDGYDVALSLNNQELTEDQNLTIQQRIESYFQNNDPPYKDVTFNKTLKYLVIETLVDENGNAIDGVTLDMIDTLVDKINDWIPTEQTDDSGKPSISLLVTGYNNALEKIRGSLR